MRLGIACSLVFATMAIAGFSKACMAQEACGLQTANFDSIFVDSFDPAAIGGGLGPALSTVSAPVLGQTPTITITHPSPGASLPGGKVQVAGTVTGSTNTGVSVAGIRAYVHNGVFLTPEITLDAAATSLDAEATSMDGLSATATAAITVSTTPADARLVADAETGFAPLPVKFRLSAADDLTVQSVSVDFDGDGSADFGGVATGDLPLYTYTQPGVYTATATLTLDNSQQIVATYRVIALDLDAQRNTVCSVYAYFRSRLSVQDAAGAGHALMGALNTRLSPLFTALGTRMPTVAAKLGTLADGLIGLDRADIVAVRDLNTEVRGYPIHFARDAKGVWRIDSM